MRASHNAYIIRCAKFVLGAPYSDYIIYALLALSAAIYRSALKTKKNSELDGISSALLLIVAQFDNFAPLVRTFLYQKCNE